MQPLSCRYFAYRELEAASQSWSAACIIGDGGFGRVYRGTLYSGAQIAIKRLDRHGLQVCAHRTALSPEVNLSLCRCTGHFSRS